jgi:hypothetical protein
VTTAIIEPDLDILQGKVGRPTADEPLLTCTP